VAVGPRHPGAADRVPEGALQAFNDEVLDLDHVTFARECAIDIPGEETEALGKIAKEYNAFVMAQAKARHPDLKDRYFNVGFIINPRGKLILKHYKVSPLFPVEHSVCPHDVYDWWVEKYGATSTPSGRWSTRRSAASAS
jgi:predicted amidohydrolase